MSYPKYVEVNGKTYPINTDFRVAIECNKISEDNSIGDLERALAIIYTLFGEEALDDTEHYDKLLELAQKYLCCGKELEESNEKPDMDFEEDMDYIETSFMSDYKIDLSNVEMHWWKFFNLMNGLSNSEMGNCCVLNRIRNLRTFNTKDIKDDKERRRIEKEKSKVALKKYKDFNKRKVKLTEQQKQSAMELYEALGLRKE